MNPAERFLWKGPGVLLTVIDGLRVAFPPLSRVPLEVLTPERVDEEVKVGRAARSDVGFPCGPMRRVEDECYHHSISLNALPKGTPALKEIFRHARDDKPPAPDPDSPVEGAG